MTERELQRTIIKYAREHGWRTAHFGNSVKIVRRKDGYKTIPDRDAVGFPDLVMLRETRIIFAELKGKGGRLTDEQMAWMQALNKVENPSLEIHIWRPVDWESGIIQRRLK